MRQLSADPLSYRYKLVAILICQCPSAYCQKPRDDLIDKRIEYQHIQLQKQRKRRQVKGDDHVDDYQWQLEHG